MSEKLSGRWAVYVGQEKVGRLSTIDPDGTPHTTPVYYALMDGEVYVGTQRNRKKFRNILRDPKVCFTIDTAEPTIKGIVIQGRAEIVEDPVIHERFREALIYRYYGHPDHPGWQYVQSLGQSVLLKIVAQKIFHWEFPGQ